MKNTPPKGPLKTQLREFVRFAIVGVVATAIHYSIYLVLLTWMFTSAAYTVGYALSMACNFLLTNVFTFRTKPNVKRGVGFVLSHAINYGLHIALLTVFLTLGVSMDVDPKTAEKMAPIFVYAIAVPVNFLLIKIIFKSDWASRNNRHMITKKAKYD